MARDHARIWISVWSDPDFTGLAAAEQALYWMLISSPDLSWCGVVDLVPERFVDLSADLTRRKFVTALGVLRTKAFVIVDEHTAEILVRSYVRRNEVLRQPNVAKAMVRAMRKLHSAALRLALVGELARIRRDDPAAKGWHGVRAEDEDLFIEIGRKASQNGSGNPSENPSRKGAPNG